MATSPSNLLFGKPSCGKSSCAISIAKAGHVPDGAATSCVQREISIFVATHGPFW